MRIAWIGLGNMGVPMASRLLAAGHSVIGHDLSETARQQASEAGIELADSAAAAVADADLVFTMLPNHDVVRTVLTGPDGVFAAARPGTLIVDSSTIDIEAARDFHRLAVEAGHRFLDAPVSGGISGASAGTLTFMVGGSDEDVAAANDVIQSMAGRIFHTGGPGNGQAAKITNNMILGITLAATCEGAVLAERLGLDANTFWELAKVSSGDNWALRTWYPIPGVVETAASNRDFEGGFATALLLKDLTLALSAGGATTTPLPFAAAAAGQMRQLADAGLANKDCSILVQLVDGTLTPLDLAPAGATSAGSEK